MNEEPKELRRGTHMGFKKVHASFDPRGVLTGGIVVEIAALREGLGVILQR